MAQESKLSIKGLFTSGNDFSAIPDGSLLKAENVDISADGVLQPRRGFQRLATGYATAADRTDQTWFYQSKQFAHHGTQYSADEISYFSSGAWTSVGAYSAPTSTSRMRALQSNQNLYFTSSLGVKKLDAYNGTVKPSGAYKGLDLGADIKASGSFLANNYTCAYRVVFGYTDVNSNLILGTPSGRAVITNNSGSARDVTLNFSIPSGVTVDWFYQVYRSPQLDNSTGLVSPSDALKLVYEGVPTAGQITAGYISVDDITPDSLRDADLYTNASQEGLTYGNEQPPLCNDIALFRNCVFYANTTNKHSYDLTLLSVYPATNGLTIDDTLTIDGIVYTAKATETSASGYFRCYTAGSFVFVDGDVSVGNDTITEASHGLSDGDAITLTTTGVLPAGLALATTYYVSAAATNTFKVSLTNGGAVVDITGAAGGGNHTVTYGLSASQQIQKTANSLVKVINRYASSTVYAFYVSGEDDLPGHIVLESRTLGGSAFTVKSADGTCWSPTGIPVSAGTELSTNDNAPNGYAFSKDGIPEAVPFANYNTVGSKASAILRIIPLKDALIFFKEDGIYRLTGFYPNFQTELLDSSSILIGNETPAILNNTIFCLTDQGVVSISDSVKIMSRPIEDDLKSLFDADLTLIKQTAFGVSYETERRYQLHMIASSASTAPEMSYVFNTFTNAWTTHTISASCGITYQNLQYLADAGSNYIMEERKSGSDLDYADFRLTTAITVINGLSITISSGVDSVAVGDILYQSDEIFATITAVDTITGIVTISGDTGFTVAAADILAGIDVDVQWAPLSMGNPSIVKQINTTEFIFKTDFVGNATIVFQTDLSIDEETSTLSGRSSYGFGLSAWGESPWGDTPSKRPMRVWVPRLKQIGSLFTISFRHKNGFSQWKLAGVTVFGESTGSERVGR